jgi:hypothetical protein
MAKLPPNCIPDASNVLPLKMIVFPAGLVAMVKAARSPGSAPLVNVAVVNPPHPAVLEKVAVPVRGKLVSAFGIPGCPKFTVTPTRPPVVRNEPVKVPVSKRETKSDPWSPARQPPLIE